MTSLPTYVVLKSQFNDKYLQYVDQGQLEGLFQFSGEDAASPYAKIQVERAESDEHLVNLKCCYNSKYLGKYSDAVNLITAVSDKPEEDPSKWSCTLFQPVVADGDNGFRFKHVNTGHYATLLNMPDSLVNNCLSTGLESPNPDLSDVFTVIDWESLVILPQYVVFKGDNGRYLSATQEGDNYLQFQAPNNDDGAATHQVFHTPHGSIRFKSIHLGKFWRRGPDNLILADSNDTSNDDKDTLFSLIKIDDKVIALSNLGNNNFCQRLTTNAKTDCLHAPNSSIIPAALLEFSEAVVIPPLFKA